MEHILPSNAKLSVTVAPFADAHTLLKAILKAVKGLNVDKEAWNTDLSLDGIQNNARLFSQIIDKVLSIATSDEVEQALFKCFERVSYNGVRVTRDLLDDPKIGEQLREDYYPICIKVIEANCKPFFKQTFSGLKAFVQTPAPSPQ